MNENSKDNASHHPHVMPLKVYLGVGAALFVLTAITVIVAQFDLGQLNIIVALAIAVFKASLVALFFMHLLYDNKLYVSVFLLGIVFLGIFIIFTMSDTLQRGLIYEEVEKPIKPDAVLYDSLKAKAVDSHGESQEGGH